MLSLYGKIIKTGMLTEKLLKLPEDQSVIHAGQTLKAVIDKSFQGSVAIRQVDAGSCNGCELEIHALNNVYYDIERYGVHFVASPRHADILMATGPVSRHMEAALRRTYEAMANPKWVIAVGDCGACGGEFGISYASRGAINNIIPVDIVINGCPPAPIDLMRGILNLFSTV
ncbi:NADH-quinone oxidoreductase subunit NuoB [Candidatus Methylospira mobilis]|uniref:NADH-quinone oxidoreductase subunit NuoB n=1 Tax=Candidatus Methylospira mobilis TaxID=1808979 RepID=A0A5Q0BR56_9GAMM|nr:NADH-quinone oxidoreductase subunit NuoB [Candidatus Methylospira mobilis]QFY44781.1 NADH-quinone oxidoreductase subunit NuoB [Candidatus Methylospira mobilis]WNV05678.1 NADH-quinone oxidoreductase subunit NuoB [Candidatus Methylospira mobilis]